MNTKIKNQNPISFVTRDRLRRFGNDYADLSLVAWLKNYFTCPGEIETVLSMYGVLTDYESDEQGYAATICPFRDERGKIRKVIAMQSNPYNGAILYQRDISRNLAKGYTLQSTPTLFGMHLIDQEPAKPVVIVEKMQDAIILSLDDRKHLYLALGGAISPDCPLTKPEILRPLSGREVTLSPSVGSYPAAVRIAGYMNRAGVATSVDRTFEEWSEGKTISQADLLLKAIEDEQFYDSYPFDEATEFYEQGFDDLQKVDNTDDSPF